MQSCRWLGSTNSPNIDNNLGVIYRFLNSWCMHSSCSNDRCVAVKFYHLDLCKEF